MKILGQQRIKKFAVPEGRGLESTENMYFAYIYRINKNSECGEYSNIG